MSFYRSSGRLVSHNECNLYFHSSQELLSPVENGRAVFMRVAPNVVLTNEQRETLTQWWHGCSTPAWLVRRARIVLLAAKGKQNIEIADKLRVERTIVARWRRRFAEQGLEAITKAALRCSGRPATKRDQVEALILHATTHQKPADVTYWTSRSLAATLGVSESMVRRVWKANGLKPHLARTFKISSGRQFIEKMTDVVGLYVNPPDYAAVLSCEVKIRVLKNRDNTLARGYKGIFTSQPLNLLNKLNGKVFGACRSRHRQSWHRYQEWVDFVEQADASTPAQRHLHVVVDDSEIYNQPKVKAWLKRHSRVHMHSLRHDSDWRALVGRWLRDMTKERSRRGASCRELVSVIEMYMKRRNPGPQPFTWILQDPLH
jgi:transposase